MEDWQPGSLPQPLIKDGRGPPVGSPVLEELDFIVFIILAGVLLICIFGCMLVCNEEQFDFRPRPFYLDDDEGEDDNPREKN